MSVSEEAKLDHLPNELTLGERIPSQLLGEMRQQGRDKVCSELVKSLWESINAILDSGTLEMLLATADKVYALYARPMVAEDSKDENRKIEGLQAIVTTLT